MTPTRRLTKLAGFAAYMTAWCGYVAWAYDPGPLGWTLVIVGGAVAYWEVPTVLGWVLFS